jgi:tetratricopeptide (TPR) repeat protein
LREGPTEKRHVSIADTFSVMAKVLKDKGQLDDAMELYDEALHIYKLNHGNGHVAVGETYYNQA